MIVFRGRHRVLLSGPLAPGKVEWTEQDDPASFEPRVPADAPPKPPGKPTKYAVERGVAPPPINTYPIYPWHEMDVGDSFLVPDLIDPKLVQNRILAAANRVRRRYGMRFRTHICREGVRVWRTE